MVKHKRLLAIGTLAIVVVALACFAVWWASRPSVSPVAVVDDLGRNVIIEAPPKRIVSMAPSATEMLFALGVGDRVVGVTDACDYPPEALKIEKIREPFGDFQIEKIVELSPDLVVMDRYFDLGGIYPPGFWLSKLEESGLTTVVLYAKDLNDVLEDIKLVGQVTWSQENATKLISTLEQRANEITNRVKGLSEEEKPRVFCTGWYDGETDPWTSGYGTFADDIIKKAGGINVAGIKAGFIQMNLEAVVWADPQIIIVLEDYRWPTPTYEAIMSDERLKNTEALKKGAVYKIDANLLSRPGPRLIDGLEEVVKVLHPELFSS